MNITFEKPITPVSEEAIDAFEGNFHFSLPATYREFLLQYNGGSPDENVFEFEDDYGSNNSTVRKFLSLGGGGDDSIEHYLGVYNGRIPANSLPIACDDGGNLICLFFDKNSDRVPVVFWDHELEEDEGETTTLFLIADSFEEFCQSLKPYEE